MQKCVLDERSICAGSTFMMIVIGRYLLEETDFFVVSATRMADGLCSDMAVIPQTQNISKTAESNPGYEEQAQRPRQICTYHSHHRSSIYTIFVQLSITCPCNLVLGFSFERWKFVGRLIPKPADGKVRSLYGARSSFRNSLNLKANQANLGPTIPEGF